MSGCQKAREGNCQTPEAAPSLPRVAIYLHSKWKIKQFGWMSFVLCHLSIVFGLRPGWLCKCPMKQGRMTNSFR
jgi:hypothetical protein